MNVPRVCVSVCVDMWNYSTNYSVSERVDDFQLSNCACFSWSPTHPCQTRRSCSKCGRLGYSVGFCTRRNRCSISSRFLLSSANFSCNCSILRSEFDREEVTLLALAVEGGAAGAGADAAAADRASESFAPSFAMRSPHISSYCCFVRRMCGAMISVATHACAQNGSKAEAKASKAQPSTQWKQRGPSQFIWDWTHLLEPLGFSPPARK